LSVDFKVRDFAYPVGILRLRKFLEKSQWFPREQLAGYQEERLRRVVRHAYHHVPYYRRLLDENGLKPSDIRGLRDLRKLPLLSREAVRENQGDLRAEDGKRYRPSPAQTSGTTGTPLRFLLDRPSNILEFVYYWRHWSWAGYRLGDCFADVRCDFFARRNSTMRTVWHYQRPFRRLLLNSLQISRAEIGRFAEALRRYRPKFIRSRPTTLYCIALFLRERGIHDITFRAVFSASETIMPKHREMIENSFSCKVLDSYGHMERCIAISQCPEGGYHLNSEYGILEVGDGSKREEDKRIGRVVCTSLHKMAMPFLRYEIEDLVELYDDDRRCPCGRTLPLLKAVHGRIRPLILSPEGRPITVLSHAFDSIPGVRAFQFVHDRPDLMLVRVVRGDAYTRDGEITLKRELRRWIGGGMTIELEHVSTEDLIRDAFGRVQMVVSRVEA
jgi:phenylacetate-CoA ligase